MEGFRDLNIQEILPLVPPADLLSQLPVPEKLAARIVKGREEIKAILSGQDQRMIIIVGPCSIHDKKAALEYAQGLAELANQLKDRLLIIMRVYFEKPRTTIGWKGFINDPNLNGQPNLAEGLFKARKLLLEIGELGLLAATEWLDPITPQYLADLISWGAIGARTSESQTHRQMASGLSMPIGFKNSTEGNIQTAIDGIFAASFPHTFLGVDFKGQASAVYTKGNPWCHLVLRGGNKGPNYDQESIAQAIKRLQSARVNSRIVIDCNHGNSGKDYKLQSLIFNNVLSQRISGNLNIIGLMLESNLFEGRQELKNPKELAYGISITDACLGWEETKNLLYQAREKLSKS